MVFYLTTKKHARGVNGSHTTLALLNVEKMSRHIIFVNNIIPPGVGERRSSGGAEIEPNRPGQHGTDETVFHGKQYVPRYPSRVTVRTVNHGTQCMPRHAPHATTRTSCHDTHLMARHAPHATARTAYHGTQCWPRYALQATIRTAGHSTHCRP